MTAARQPEPIVAWAVPGIPEIGAGDDLAAIVADAVEADAAGHPDRAPRAGDILVVTSKVVSKAEGRVIAAADREDAITAETVRVVATRAYDGGVTRIVENRQGVVGAAAGVDASNVPDGHVLLLPVDPDASARALRDALRARFGVELGVIVSDTLGRAWRLGQTDIAIGAAGVRVVDDLRGQTDAAGKPLAVTQPAVGDELAGLGDLVKGKAEGCPVAVVRGASRFVLAASDETEPFGTGRSLARTGQTDMFRLGTDEALAEGYRRGLAAGLALGAGDGSAPDRSAADRSARDASAAGVGAGRPRWVVVVPFKGGDGAKSRMGGVTGLDRRQLSLAFLRDTLRAARQVESVSAVLVVSNASGLEPALDGLADGIVADPGTGLNGAVAAGAEAARKRDPGAFVAVLVGDLPGLDAADLHAALDLAVEAARGGHPYAFVPDSEGTGTTTLMAAPGAVVSSRFGAGSRAQHAAAGYLELDIPPQSTLRLDIDDPAALHASLAALGEETRGLFG